MPYSPYYDAPDTDCVEFHRWTQRQIERLQPDVVVMSTDTQFRYVRDDGSQVENKREIAAMIEQGMIDRIDQMAPHVGRIIVLADAPRLMVHPSIVSERAVTMADTVSEPNKRSMLMRRFVKSAAKKAGVDYVETRQWFCAHERCPVVIGDYISRRDYGHISLEYAAALEKPLDRALELE
jgi:fructose-specific component phosphotransferase system IIB-like protein